LRQALLFDPKGDPIRQDHKVLSTTGTRSATGRTRSICHTAYPPRASWPAPDSTMHSAQIGRITVTRFAYGIPVNIKESQDAGHAVVLTTIGDNATHFVDATRAEAIAIGESSAVDCSRTDYNVDFDPDHLQLNLTIPHSVLERVCRDWFGFVPDNVLCQYKTRIGGNNSSWLALMEYIVRCITDAPSCLCT